MEDDEDNEDDCPRQRLQPQTSVETTIAALAAVVPSWLYYSQRPPHHSATLLLLSHQPSKNGRTQETYE